MLQTKELDSGDHVTLNCGSFLCLIMCPFHSKEVVMIVGVEGVLVPVACLLYFCSPECGGYDYVVHISTLQSIDLSKWELHALDCPLFLRLHFSLSLIFYQVISK